MRINIYFTSIKGRRDTNEDSHNIELNISKQTDEIKSMHLFGIYDGHGGDKVSKYLKKNIPKYYCSSSICPPYDSSYHNKLFKNIQKDILKNKIGYTMGSTCLINLMYKYREKIYMNIVNLGDCRLVIVNKDGFYNQVTTDHKPDDSKEKTRIVQMGGEIYKDSDGIYRVGDLSLSRAFGDEDNAPFISQIPDVYVKEITADTKYIVMACDGLWDVIDNKDLFNLINFYKKNKSVNYASDLANEALKKGSSDNISIIIIEILSK